MPAVTIYLLAMTLANISVATFGPWVSPINAFLLIGLDLSLRDHLHDRWAGRGLWWRMGLLISAAGALSYALNPAAGRIAIASVAAFVASGIVDAITYHLLRRSGPGTRVNASNAAGAAIDSMLFPTIAFGALLPTIVALQFGAKFAGGSVWWAIISRVRNAARAT